MPSTYLFPVENHQSSKTGTQEETVPLGAAVRTLSGARMGAASSASTAAKGPGDRLRHPAGTVSYGVAAARDKDSTFAGTPLGRIGGSGSCSKDRRRSVKARPMEAACISPALRKTRLAEPTMAQSLPCGSAILRSLREGSGSSSAARDLARTTVRPQWWEPVSHFLAGKTCSGKHGHCSFRRGRHVQLDGGAATAAAAAYPSRLGFALARELAFSRELPAGRRVVLDFFAGSLAVTTQLGNFAIDTLVIDSRFGCDALAEGFANYVCQLIGSGKIYACMIAMPRSSFSLAQSRSGFALRSQTAPRGIETNDPRRQARISLGNKLLDFTIQVIKCCNKISFPFILEDPVSSYAWHDSQLKNALCRSVMADVHQCAFGARFRKATRFMFGKFPNGMDHITG